ncbi:MAG: tetratricopeptide repeat protein [Gammaproteobacteria bacterium]|jgi:tetratricopeptide (TPR) repeat protein|nr:tetratricopeptide repeat protein [Gammaproteobacteria bacterium]
MRTGLLVAILCAGGCPALAEQPAAAEKAVPTVEERPVAALPFAEPAPPAGELGADAVYSFLVGEIAADRGQLPLAYNHYSHAAALAHDPYAAERAARIAISMKDRDVALRAVRRWVDLAPNAVPARQALAHVLLLQGDAAGVREQFDAILAIAAARGEDGFLQVGAVAGAGHGGALGPAVMGELVDAYAGDARAHYALALTLAAAKSYAEAGARLQRAIDIDPDWQKPWLLKVQILTAEGRNAEARDVLRGVVERRPDDGALRNAYAALLVQAKDYPAALAEYKVLRRLQPGDADVLFATALLAMQAKDWDEARDAFEALLASGDRQDEARWFLAQTKDLAGDRDAAFDLYSRIETGPYRADAAMRRAGLMAKRGDLQAALELLRGLRGSEPSRSADIYLAEAELLQKHGTTEEVAAVYAAAIAAHPNDLQIYYARALDASQRGRLADAEADFKRVLAREPEHADALNALGYTLAELSDRYPEALGYVERALKLKPDNPAFLDSMGWVQYRLGNHAAALDYLRRAVAAIDDAEVAAHLGEVLWVTGERDEARRVWAEALARDPENDYLRRTIERFPP